MLPTLPEIRAAFTCATPDLAAPRRRPRVWALALLGLWGLGALPGVARALELELSAPHLRGSYVWIDARLSDLIPEPVARSLSRGMPATLQLHVELWRRRTAWFDRMDGSFDASVRIRYEVWSDTYRIERSGGPAVTLASLDSVRALLERPIELPARRAALLEDDARYFVVVSATLTPLSVEDVQEMEGWLSGEVESHREAGLGVFAELPRSLFDTVRNFTGFGDRHARAETAAFSAASVATPH
ncbi:MAG: DUF4390 domain-containing protein [Candidatus Eiseniibacteriota bacterium]